MNKWIALLLVLALALGCAGCGKDDETARLESENAALQQQLDALNAQMESMESTAQEALKDWHLSAEVWEGGSGATVKVSAVPGSYHEGQSALFSVRLGGFEVASVVCDWNGTGYTAQAELEPADGYSYYVTLTGADGTREQIALDTPENTLDDTLVNLGSSMAAYGNIIVDNWSGDDKTIRLDSGFIQVQLPRLTSGSEAALEEASLVFQLNGQEIQRRALDLPAGEGDGSYELAFTDITFDMPAMESDYQLDLWLTVKLTDGYTFSVSGGSWYHSADGLMMVVG